MTKINDLTLAGPRPPIGRGRRAGRRAATVGLGASPLWSFNLLTWIPFVAIAWRSRRARDWAIAAGYGAATVVGVIWTQNTATIGAEATIAIMTGASIHAFYTLSRLDRPGRTAAGQDTAIANAVAAREHRMQARSILAADPILARDLRIGRPDRLRDYDDGGLVDVNNAPASALTGALGLTETEAAQLIAAREELGLLQDVDDLTVYADIDPRRVHTVHDLIVFGPA
jgi:DNA uptake protein ComE-like DNA-binding protein